MDSTQRVSAVAYGREGREGGSEGEEDFSYSAELPVLLLFLSSFSTLFARGHFLFLI